MKHKKHLYFTTLFLLYGYFGIAQTGKDSVSSNFSQIKGTYCDRGQGYTNCITFINDSLFEYSLNNYMDVGYQETGKGIYKEESGKLILSFCYADSLKTSSYLTTIGKCKDKDKDSLSMKFLIQDSYNNDLIPFAELLLTDSLNYFKKIHTDIDGIAQINIPKSIQTIFVSVSFIGFEKYSFKTSPANCQTINIRLHNFGRIVSEGTKMTYEITRITSSELQLKKDGRDIILKKER